MPARPAAFDRIARALSRVRRRLRARSALVASGLGAAVLGGVALLAVVLAAWTGPALRWPAIFLMGGGVLWVLGRHLLGPWWRFARDPAVAGHVEAALPELRDGLLACVQFEGEWASGEHQPELVAGLAERVAGHLDETELAPLTPFAPARRPWILAGLVALAWGGAALLAPKHVSAGVSSLFPEAVEGRTRKTGPLVGDLVLKLEFPAHVHRATRVVPNSTGDLEVPKGTRVSLTATTLEPARSIAIRFGEEGPELPLSLSEGRDAQGTFVAEKASAWRFTVVNAAEEILVEEVERRLRIEADRAPKVTLKWPAEDLELEDIRDVEVQFEAEDDFGLSKVEIVVALDADAENPERVPQAGVKGRRFAAEDTVDLSVIQARSGDRIALWVEAYDNNSVDGPQRGQSVVRRITLRSPQEKHYALSAKLRETIEALLKALADRLENDWPGAENPPLSERVGALVASTNVAMKALESAVEGLKEDPLTAEEVRLALLGRLGTLEKAVAKEAKAHEKLSKLLEAREDAAVRGAQRLSDAIVEELEQTIVLVEAMVARMALEDMKALTDELQAAREQLKDLMRQYKDNPDDAALKKRILRDLKRLRQRMKELRERMAQLAKKMPKEFLNLEGMKNDEMQKGLSKADEQIDQLEKMIEEGRIDEALAMMDEMQAALDEMQAALDEDMQDLHDQTNPQMQKAISELMDQARDLQQRQKKISKETEAAAKRQAEALKKMLEEELKERLDGIKKDAEALRGVTERIEPQRMATMAEEQLNHLQQRVDELNSALDQKQLMEALEMAERAMDHLDTLRRYTQHDSRAKANREEIRKGQQLDESVMRALSELLEQAQQRARQQARQQAQQTSGRKKKAEKKAEEEGEEEGEQAGQQPGQQPGGQGLPEQQGQLSQDTGKFRRRLQQSQQMVPGLPGEAMQQVQRAAEAMQRAGQQLGQGRPRRARPGQQQAQSELQSLMESIQQAAKPKGAQRGKQQRGRRTSREKVRIPGAEEHQAPEAFRKDLLEAMKERPPEDYREQVKRYYESLIK